jgi:hypothetical protein
VTESKSGPVEPEALWRILGTRRPPKIGISPKDFRASPILEPSQRELTRYSENPRNRYGDWYEARIASVLEASSKRLNFSVSPHVPLDYQSPVYAGDRIVDLLIAPRQGHSLGLEMKYLHGNGSLVKPKVLADAIDFTHRPVDCIYVIDGPGWHETKNVEYLATWWSFTDTAHLEQTLAEFFQK